MFNNEQGIAKIENQLWFGNFNKWRFKKYFEVNEKELKKLGKFTSIEEFIIKYWKKQKPLDYILSKLNIEEGLILLTKPLEPSPEEFESYWFRDLNEKCLGCIHDCKQSVHVILIQCPQYKKEFNKIKNENMLG